jgi:Uma2 family endonuclease
VALRHRVESDLLTGEELSQRPDLESSELVEGRVVRLSPTSLEHGKIELRPGAALLAYAEASGRGKAGGGEVGIYVRRSPDTVRAADALFLSNERYARRGSTRYLDVAPELAAEILSPDDRWSEVMAKIEEYLAAGVIVVWVVDPTLHHVLAYRSLTEVQRFAEGDVLADPEILPGFGLPVEDLLRE